MSDNTDERPDEVAALQSEVGALKGQLEGIASVTNEIKAGLSEMLTKPAPKKAGVV